MITNNGFNKPHRPHQVVRIDENFRLLLQLGILMKQLRYTTRDQRAVRVEILDKMGVIGERIFLDTFILDLEVYEKMEADRVGGPKPQTFEDILTRVKASALDRFNKEQTEIYERHEHHKTWLGSEVVEMIFDNESKEAA